jgi:hypothetical protein
MAKLYIYLINAYMVMVACSCFGTDTAPKAFVAFPSSNPSSHPSVLVDAQSLQLVVNLMKTIKDDKDYHSFHNMMDDVKAEHTIKYHKPNAPFFYTNDKIVLKDIVTLVMRNPSGIIDDTKNGHLKVYRDFDYHDDLEDIFGQEPLYQRDLKVNKQFQDDYAGQTPTGPTNRVMISLKIKGDEQNENTFAKRIVYTGNNIDFIDAYPSKGLPPKPKPKDDGTTKKPSQGTAGKTPQDGKKSRGCGCGN